MQRFEGSMKHSDNDSSTDEPHVYRGSLAARGNSPGGLELQEDTVVLLKKSKENYGRPCLWRFVIRNIGMAATRVSDKEDNAQWLTFSKAL